MSERSPKPLDAQIRELLDRLYRVDSGRILATLIRLLGDFDLAEEAMHEAFAAALSLPDDFDPSAVTEAMIEEIHALNREMIAAGVRKFACGISPAANAKTVRKQPDGTVLVTDGPYTETKEHMGGFWILEAADMDEALAWARKGAISCDAAGEVRELLFFPAPEESTE